MPQRSAKRLAASRALATPGAFMTACRPRLPAFWSATRTGSEHVADFGRPTALSGRAPISIRQRREEAGAAIDANHGEGLAGEPATIELFKE